MKIVKCRNCKSPKIERVFSLGNIYYTGKFPRKNHSPKKGPINVVICKKCTLVQLENNFDLNYLYGPDYGYRTGINETMTEHVKKVVQIATKITRIKKNDQVLKKKQNNYAFSIILCFCVFCITFRYHGNSSKKSSILSTFFDSSIL